MITSWGTWQAALSRPSRRPLVVDALVGSLGTPEQGSVLVDVSAGVGFFSLAAAARGHTVVAFESSTRSLEAFSAGVVYNGFNDRIRLYNVSLGAAPETVCIKRKAAPAGAPGGVAAGGEAAGHNDATATATRRGYGDPELHATPASECESLTVRQTLSHMLMASDGQGEGAAAATAATATGAGAAAGGAAAGSGVILGERSLASRVGALRLSAHGWEGWILDGAQAWLERDKPGVVLLEYSPTLVAKTRYPGGGQAVLERLHSLGYVHMAHAGYVCDERWFNISRALRAGGTAVGGGAAVAAKLPGAGVVDGGEHGVEGGEQAGAGPLPHRSTWCKLKPELFQVLTDRAHPEVAENVIFIHSSHPSVQEVVDGVKRVAGGDTVAAMGLGGSKEVSGGAGVVAGTAGSEMGSSGQGLLGRRGGSA